MDEAYFDFECTFWNDLPKSLSKLNACIVNKVIPIQIKSGEKWDIIRIEIWEDTGKFIAFPAQIIFTTRTDVAGAQIICRQVANEVDKIIYSDKSEEIQQLLIKEVFAKMTGLLKTHLLPIAQYSVHVYSSYGDKVEI